MMNYDELVNTLTKIAQATQSLSRFEPYFKSPSWDANRQLLKANEEAEILVREKDLHADWIDRATRFLMTELAIVKEGFAIRKIKALPHSVQPGDFKNLEDALVALRTLMTEEQHRYRLSPDSISCLVVTALPLEFRAFIRRAYQIGEPTDLQAFSCAFNPKFDREESARKQVKIECVLRNDKAKARVLVLLPARRASLSVQQEINDIVKNELTFGHLVLVGVAGHLDRTEKFGICDVVVSNQIYDSHDRRVRETIDFKNKRLFSFDVPSGLTLDGWQPRTLCEPRPAGTFDFRKTGTGPIVSGPESVALGKYKAVLQEAFPDCVAVEMEAAGCCWAVERNGIPVTVVKSICDWSDESKTKYYQRYCADLAAHVAIDYICDLYGSDGS